MNQNPRNQTQRSSSVDSDAQLSMEASDLTVTNSESDFSSLQH